MPLKTPDALHLRALSDAQQDADERGISRDYLYAVADLMDEFIERRQFLALHGKPKGTSKMYPPLSEPVAEAPRTLGQLLKEARGKKSQEQVAAAFQRHQVWLSNFETGKTYPDKDALEKLLDYYRVQDREKFRDLLMKQLVTSNGHLPPAA